MIKKLIKNFSIITAPIFILVLVAVFLYTNPDKIYYNNLNKAKNLNSLMTSDSVETQSTYLQKDKQIELYPGGISVGVKISNKGALVVGYSQIETNEGLEESPGKLAGIELGDIIQEVNGNKIETCNELISQVKLSKKEDVEVKILRENTILEKRISLLKEGNESKIGLWVRDSTAGIGTLTFYDKNTEVFGALGHPITDGDTNACFNIKNGVLLRSSVLNIKKGQRGAPGEIKGLFINENESIGNILKNTSTGIYGKGCNELINANFNTPMPIAYKEEIKEGSAQIITTVDDSGAKAYDIEILKLLSQDEPSSKSMVIKVVDEELLEKTGGIVQGMSGSPIIQNGKIIGAVTHVLINKPDIGYGIYIEWMLQDSGIIN